MKLRRRRRTQASGRLIAAIAGVLSAAIAVGTGADLPQVVAKLPKMPI